jgi:ABC-2 type transport system ATP-binding protein
MGGGKMAFGCQHALAFAEMEAIIGAMSNPLLTIEHLRVDFPDVVAVDDLSLTVEAGDVYGLIGPNGAGKTTTMRAVSGLQESTRGSVNVCGFDLAREPPELKKRLGFMPDFCPVYDRLTTTEFLDHFARAYNATNRRQSIEQCLEITWLTEKRDSLCGELSRGMKQRLVLAKTLLPAPQVLLLDEPASGLDPLGRIELRKLLLQLQDSGRAVLISSHILTELSGFCNKAAIMERGRLVMSGTIAELGQKMGRRRMSVKWRADGDKALEILKGAGAKNLEPTAQGATFEFEGDSCALDGLLKTLVVEGVRVTEWRGVGDDLEQIFLQSGAKELM